MRILSSRNIRNLFVGLCALILLLCAAVQVCSVLTYGHFSVPLLLITLSFGFLILLCFIRYFRIQDRQLEEAVTAIQSFLSGNREKRLECNEDGEIYRLFHAINTMAAVQNAQSEREKRTNEFLKKTIFDISHQLKTPLAALNIYNDLITESDDPETVRKFAASSEHELDRIGSLIRSLLTLTRLDAGAVVFEKTRQNVRELLEDISDSFTARAAQEGKTLALRGSEKEVLLCDRGWISEAFANLIQNALDHTSKGGEISIGWSMSGNMLSVTVEDNGRGIDPEDMDNIFRRFYRSKNSSDRQGVGLGLPLSKSIFESHNGTIFAESRPGCGARFTVNFLNPAGSPDHAESPCPV